MMKHYISTLLVFLLATSCENKTIDHSKHNMHDMHDMKGKDTSTVHQDTTSIESYLDEVINPVNEVVISNQETVKPIKREFGNTIFNDGYISVDERRNNKISARFGGRIEKLHVKYNYQYVKKGEKIMELFSPEIITMEEEYIHHLMTFSDKNLIQKTKEKLVLLGLSENEITTIEKTGKPLEAIPIYSPYEGYVLFDTGEKEFNTSTKEMPNGMNMGVESDKNKSSMQATPTQIKEGSYVKEGQLLFVVNDLKVVWAIIALNTKDESGLKINSPVSIVSELTDDPVHGIINFIEPGYKTGQKFTQARIYLKNDNQHYKINSLVTMQISEEGKVVSVPNSSVLDLGKKKMVWIKSGETKGGSKLFKARSVIAGNDRNGFTEIISGITEKDEIAKGAGYLIDSESLIKEK
ncbi:MAG: hypothetical protein A3F72_14000 [Bacteroidetes bacterium RIFCSPLOWO2_12_FULL_35_15]|nr:MAG: hypothetical protein A3F72_14000 [Bacteroidetes bacterium RIFCSPLOWO2_12_FULL_35_15]